MVDWLFLPRNFGTVSRSPGVRQRVRQGARWEETEGKTRGETGSETEGKTGERDRQ